MKEAATRDCTGQEQAADGLRKAEELFSKVFHASPVIIAVTTYPKGLYVDVNEHFISVLGYTREEVLGRRALELGVWAKPEQRAEVIRRIEAGESVREFECELRTKGGEVRHAVVGVEMIVLGEQRCLLFINHDITVRKREESARREVEERLQKISDRLPGVIYQYRLRPDGTSHFPYASEAIRNIYRVAPEEVMEDAAAVFAVLHREDYEGIVASIQKSARELTPWIYEYRVKFSDGTVRWLSGNALPMREPDGSVLWHGFIADVTERKGMEQAVHDVNAQLELRVAQRTAELEEANGELEAFSYSVSHDLRTPLRAIDGYSLAVLEDYGPALPAEGRRYLETIRRGAQRMGELIDALLALSRLSRSPLTHRAVDVGSLVDDALKELSGQMEGRRIEVRKGELPWCWGDPALLKQVWVNLLSNAFKYSARREAAVVEIGCAIEAGESVYFVRDNGTGFDMAYARKLFKVFQRLHRTEDYEGAGIGLAIVQRVIHRHGGRVWAEGGIDRGATFYFTLKEQTEP